ncbi:MAG TPA: precorrin-2 C(20)-methyltransferase [Polyangiales bacterium]
MSSDGTMFGVGVGPGDPELITLKAARVLREADVVAFFAKHGQPGNARTAAAALLPPSTELLPLYYPYTTEIPPRHPEYVKSMRAFYDQSAARVAEQLTRGRNVAVLCEGDPLLYGSYMYLHDRLAKRHRCVVIPGITSFLGCAAVAGLPLVSTDRTFSIVPGTLPEDELKRRLASGDGLAVIKLGRNLPKVRRALAELGRLHEAVYFERGTTSAEVRMPLAEKTDDRSIYFALVLVPAHDGGPYRARGEQA